MAEPFRDEFDSVVERAFETLMRARGEDLDPSRRAALRAWLARQPEPEAALGRLILGLEVPFADPFARPAELDARDLGWEAPRRTVGVSDWTTVIRPVADPEGLSERARRHARVGLWARNAGIVVLLFLAFQWWGTGFEQRRAQARLAGVFAASVHNGGGGGSSTTTSGAPAASGAARGVGAPLPGGVVARLQIPKIHVDQYVVEGTGEAELKRGPGHYVGSALPGQHGNSAIAGHRTTYGAPFNRLGDLVPGDTIIATTATGQYLYVVAQKVTVSPSQSSVVDDYGDDRLTLTTCTPEFLATSRLIVFASLQGAASATLLAHVTPPPPLAGTTPRPGAADRHLRDSGTSGFHWGAWPLALVGAALLACFGLLYRPLRGWVPPAGAFLILVPLWAGGLLYFFEQLNRFLPANV